MKRWSRAPSYHHTMIQNMYSLLVPVKLQASHTKNVLYMKVFGQNKAYISHTSLFILPPPQKKKTLTDNLFLRCWLE